MLQSPSGGTQAKDKANIVNYQFLFTKIALHTFLSLMCRHLKPSARYAQEYFQCQK